MNKLAVVLLGMGLSISGLTQAAGVGFVDLAKVVDSSSYLKQQNASLNQSVKPTTTKLEQLGKELDALRQKAETEGRNMKEADVQKGLQTRVQGTLQTMNNTFETRVKQAGEQLRQENNLDFILNKNAAVAYDAKNDLTDKMIQKVNAIK